MTQNAQSRAQRRAAERNSRAALFGRFLDEAAKLYSDALQTSRDDVTGLIQIYALTNRIRLLSSPQVVEAADTVVRIIVDTYLGAEHHLAWMRENGSTSISIPCGISVRRAEKSCRRLTPPGRRARGESAARLQLFRLGVHNGSMRITLLRVRRTWAKPSAAKPRPSITQVDGFGAETARPPRIGDCWEFPDENWLNARVSVGPVAVKIRSTS